MTRQHLFGWSLLILLKANYHNMTEKKRLTDEEYQFIFSRAVRLCLDFIVVKNNKVLLAKREIEPNKGSWSLPGGMVRYQETIDQAAERIIGAELGLKIKEKNLFGYMEFPHEINQNGTLIHSVSLAFLTTLEDGELRGSDQAREIEFFEILPQEAHSIHHKFLQENWSRIT